MPTRHRSPAMPPPPYLDPACTIERVKKDIGDLLYRDVLRQIGQSGKPHELPWASATRRSEYADIQRSLREAKSLIAGIHWRKLRQCPPPGLRNLHKRHNFGTRFHNLMQGLLAPNETRRSSALRLIPLFPLNRRRDKEQISTGKHIVHDHQGSCCYGDPDCAGARLIPVHSDGASDQRSATL